MAIVTPAGVAGGGRAASPVAIGVGVSTPAIAGGRVTFVVVGGVAIPTRTGPAGPAIAARASIAARSPVATRASVAARSPVAPRASIAARPAGSSRPTGPARAPRSASPGVACAACVHGAARAAGLHHTPAPASCAARPRAPVLGRRFGVLGSTIRRWTEQVVGGNSLCAPGNPNQTRRKQGHNTQGTPPRKDHTSRLLPAQEESSSLAALRILEFVRLGAGRSR